MTDLDDALDVALEHVAWLHRSHARRHRRCRAEMRALGLDELAGSRRAGACHVRVAALAVAWLGLMERG